MPAAARRRSNLRLSDSHSAGGASAAATPPGALRRRLGVVLTPYFAGRQAKSQVWTLPLPAVYSITAYSPGSSGCIGQIL